MALHFNNDPTRPYDSNLDIKEYAIGGKLLTASLMSDENTIQSMGKDFIKEKLAVQLAMGMLENKMVEFTSMRDHLSLSIKIHARCYLTPDNQVKIIRELKDGRF
jgi:hypothetical protein